MKMFKKEADTVVSNPRIKLNQPLEDIDFQTIAC